MTNRKKDKTLVRVTVSLDPDDYKAFELIAREEDRPTAYLIRKAMKAFLDERNKLMINTVEGAG